MTTVGTFSCRVSKIVLLCVAVTIVGRLDCTEQCHCFRGLRSFRASSACFAWKGCVGASWF